MTENLGQCTIKFNNSVVKGLEKSFSQRKDYIYYILQFLLHLSLNVTGI